MFRKSSYMLYVNSYQIPNIFNSKTMNVLKTINCILLTQFKKYWNFLFIHHLGHTILIL